MQPLQVCIGPIIRIGRESWCLPYAGFLVSYLLVVPLGYVQDFQSFSKDGQPIRGSIMNEAKTIMSLQPITDEDIEALMEEKNLEKDILQAQSQN